jgi:lipopolysaccharide export system protein LptA
VQGGVQWDGHHLEAAIVIDRRCRMRHIHGIAVALLASIVAASPAAAQNQGQRCRNLEFEPRSTSTSVIGVLQPGGSYVSYASGGIIVLCRTEGIRLVADSGEYYQASEIVYLFGNVHYTEKGTAVDAQRITYWKMEERILAERDVVARLSNGTRMTGPRADYYRAAPGLRPRAQLRATERPHITLVRADTANQPAAPPPAPVRPQTVPAAPQPRVGTSRPADTTVVDANTVFMDGDSLIYASGKVIVTRPDVVATSDSLFLDRATERARFLRDPVITGSGERPFRLTGSVIDLFSRERRLERVLSRVAAKVVSQDIQLVADTIDLRLADNRLQRAFAWGTSRAHAVSTAQDMTADSIEIVMPAQRIRQVRAVGKALAESAPDSTKIVSTERDWLRGDTIIALFDSIAATDTTSKPRIRELLAKVRASSFYQIPPDDSTSRCPKINYARGHEIRVAFDSQAVQRVTVADSVNADGVYLECVATSPAKAAGGPPSTPPARRPNGVPPSAVPVPRPPPDAGRRR